jgi:hypothetical protein
MMADDKDKTNEAVEFIATTVFAWLKSSADPDGKVEFLRGEVGDAAERMAVYLVTELVDFFQTMGWPINIQAEEDATVSVIVKD